MERKQVRLGIIGYGDIGSGIGSGLRKEGLASIVAYDIASETGKFSALMKRRAGEANVELLKSPAELAERADFIIAAVPGINSVEAASAFVGLLGARHHYIDIASATPKVKKGVAAVLEPGGVRVADGGIEGSALTNGYKIPILASGPAARTFVDTFVPWGMVMQVVGPDIGTGSGIKILRSVIMKGMEALFVECGLGSARYGLQDQVFESLVKTIDARGFAETLRSFITTDVVHAERRFHEVEMSAEALEDVGIEPIMTRSTARHLKRVVDMGLKEHFEGVAPKDYKTALQAIEDRLPSRQKATV